MAIPGLHVDPHAAYSSLERLRDLALEHDAELFYAHDKESYPRYLKAPTFYSCTRRFARQRARSLSSRMAAQQDAASITLDIDRDRKQIRQQKQRAEIDLHEGADYAAPPRTRAIEHPGGDHE
jgi:hypothetical protein